MKPINLSPTLSFWRETYVSEAEIRKSRDLRTNSRGDVRLARNMPKHLDICVSNDSSLQLDSRNLSRPNVSLKLYAIYDPSLSSTLLRRENSKVASQDLLNSSA